MHGHRGRVGNDAWAYRQRLVRDGRALSDREWNRLRRLFRTDDPSGQAPDLRDSEAGQH